MKTFGSGQTSGQPLLLTSTAQVVHTAPAGSATPHRVSVSVQAQANANVTLEVYNSSGTKVATVTRLVKPDVGADFDTLDLNGTSVVKASTDGTGVYLIAEVDDQTDVAGTSCQNLASGLVAAVQNASRHAVGAQGGTGQATEANANITIAKAGIIRNMRVVSDATVGGGATVTVTLRINGADSGLQQTLAAADTTVAKTDTDSVAVAAGDKVCFKVACDNAGAPAANIHACAEYVAS